MAVAYRVIFRESSRKLRTIVIGKLRFRTWKFLYKFPSDKNSLIRTLDQPIGGEAEDEMPDLRSFARDSLDYREGLKVSGE